ncbi:MAG: protein translocase subunit SecD [Bacillota bacterium]|nr:protein translocase subunit SecD [Bacillota bacterium]
MKKINKGTVFLTAMVTIAISLLAAFGLHYGILNIKGVRDIRFGTDIRGGVEAIFSPKDLNRKPTASELEATRTVLETRLDAKNILDREITVDKNNGEVILRFPWKSGQTDFNPRKAISELGETALLTFRDPQGNILVEGKNVKSAMAELDQQTNEYVVKLEFDSAGATAFENATAKLVGQQMGIYMDQTLISNPKVNQRISGGSAVITGMETMDNARELASKINSGSLPFSIESKNYSIISPSLGSGTLKVMLMAGLFAFILVCLFMLLYYRLPGLVAWFGLALQLAIQLLLLSIPQITLTLPGIAGVILSIGMGVDANVIISERIKEEIRSGKSIPAAIDLGYHRAFSAVFDGNITAAIVAIVLMALGSGAMLSFGYTLLSGVLLNFLSGVLSSKLMITSLSKYPALQKPFLYGGKSR